MQRHIGWAHILKLTCSFHSSVKHEGEVRPFLRVNQEPPQLDVTPLGKLTVWPWKWPIYSGNKQIPTPTARVELLIYWRVNSEINVVLQWNQRLLSFSPRVWTFPVPLNSLQGLVQWMPQYLQGYRWDVGKVRWSMQLIPGFVCRTNHFTTT